MQIRFSTSFYLDVPHKGSKPVVLIEDGKQCLSLQAGVKSKVQHSKVTEMLQEALQTPNTFVDKHFKRWQKLQLTQKPREFTKNLNLLLAYLQKSQNEPASKKRKLNSEIEGIKAKLREIDELWIEKLGRHRGGEPFTEFCQRQAADVHFYAKGELLGGHFCFLGNFFDKLQPKQVYTFHQPDKSAVQLFQTIFKQFSFLKEPTSIDSLALRLFIEHCYTGAVRLLPAAKLTEKSLRHMLERAGRVLQLQLYLHPWIKHWGKLPFFNEVSNQGMRLLELAEAIKAGCPVSVYQFSHPLPLQIPIKDPSSSMVCAELTVNNCKLLTNYALLLNRSQYFKQLFHDKKSIKLAGSEQLKQFFVSWIKLLYGGRLSNTVSAYHSLTYSTFVGRCRNKLPHEPLKEVSHNRETPLGKHISETSHPYILEISQCDNYRTLNRMCAQSPNMAMAPSELQEKQTFFYGDQSIAEEVYEPFKSVTSAQVTDQTSLQHAMAHFNKRLTNLEIQAARLFSDDASWNETLEQLPKSCPNLEKLALVNCSNLAESIIVKLIQQCKHLKELSLINLKFVSAATFRAITEYLPELRLLSIAQLTNVTVEHLRALPVHCKNLQEVYLAPTVDLESRTIDSNRIDEDFVLSLAHNCPDLRRVHLVNADLSDRAVKTLIDKCGYIEWFSLKDEQNLPVKTTIQTLQNLAHWRSLRLLCITIDEQDANLPFAIYEAALKKLAENCPMLEKITISLPVEIPPKIFNYFSIHCPYLSKFITN